jgi:hypothetical protein
LVPDREINAGRFFEAECPKNKQQEISDGG